MQIAVLSDIHSNFPALEKCVSYCLDRQIRTFFFLGDYLGELAYPQKTMELLFSLNEIYHCRFIRGNKEDYWLNYKASGETGWKEFDSTTGSLFYTYHHLTTKDMAFFERLPLRTEAIFENLPHITLCHGSPRKTNEKLLPNSPETFRIMEQETNAYILCGHTHIQGSIVHGGKQVYNPGSVGLPMESGGKAQFLILHGSANAWEPEWISLDYDTEQAAEDLSRSGLSEKAPCWCRVTEQILRTGKHSHGAVLSRAMELCRQQEGECIWPWIPEKYWEEAVKQTFCLYTAV